MTDVSIDGEWHHVAIVIRKDRTVTYVDGKRTKEGTR